VNLALWLAASALSCLLFSAVAWAEPSLAQTPSASEEATPIDLNRASVAELTRLPGIGQKRAEAIVAFRESHGGFQSVTQLLKIKGIGRAMLRKLRLLVTVSDRPSLPRDTALATAKTRATGTGDIHRVR
jgi:competence protein ComEA